MQQYIEKGVETNNVRIWIQRNKIEIRETHWDALNEYKRFPKD